jgi:hypothetical protein
MRTIRAKELLLWLRRGEGVCWTGENSFQGFALICGPEVDIGSRLEWKKCQIGFLRYSGSEVAELVAAYSFIPTVSH